MIMKMTSSYLDRELMHRVSEIKLVKSESKN